MDDRKSSKYKDIGVLNGLLDSWHMTWWLRFFLEDPAKKVAEAAKKEAEGDKDKVAKALKDGEKEAEKDSKDVLGKGEKDAEGEGPLFCIKLPNHNYNFSSEIWHNVIVHWTGPMIKILTFI